MAAAAALAHLRPPADTAEASLRRATLYVILLPPSDRLVSPRRCLPAFMGPSGGVEVTLGVEVARKRGLRPAPSVRRRGRAGAGAGAPGESIASQIWRVIKDRIYS